MRMIANVFGLELGEKFKVRGCGYSGKVDYEFTERGLFRVTPPDKPCFMHSGFADITLRKILTGQVQVVPHRMLKE